MGRVGGLPVFKKKNYETSESFNMGTSFGASAKVQKPDRERNNRHGKMKEGMDLRLLRTRKYN